MTCTASTPCQMSPVPLSEISVRWDGPAVGRKAVAFPGRRTIYLDRRFWQTLRSIDARAAILAHERGHIEGARCESCADRRAGEIMRREGAQTPRDGARALAGRLENRDAMQAANDFLDGFGLDDGMLLHRERAGALQAPLVALLDELARTGLTVNGVTYRVAIGYQGGSRTAAEQLALYAKGREQLADGSWRVVDPSAVVTDTLKSRHLNGKAVDLYPVLPSGAYATSDNAELFHELWRRARARGLVAGSTISSGIDWPHVEVPESYAAPLAAGVAFAVLGVAIALLTK